jgi:hypothetical protein
MPLETWHHKIVDRWLDAHRDGQPISEASLLHIIRFWSDHRQLEAPLVTITPDGTFCVRWGSPVMEGYEFLGGNSCRLLTALERTS